jgi:hypothetical protein
MAAKKKRNRFTPEYKSDAALTSSMGGWAVNRGDSMWLAAFCLPEHRITHYLRSLSKQSPLLAITSRTIGISTAAISPASWPTYSSRRWASSSPTPEPHKGEQGFNSQGQGEIPRIVWEEMLVNALIHRDYFISAPVRVLVFADRVEIISPGHLPNNLTIENIKAGNSNMRNPILASFAAKLLTYLTEA